MYLWQGVICLITDRFQPLAVGILTGDLYSQVGKPTVRGSSVPVLDPGWDHHHVAGMEFLGSSSPGLVVTAPCRTKENLSASRPGMVDMPVVPASGFKGNVPDGKALGSKHVQVALTYKVLCICGVFLSNWKIVLGIGIFSFI